MNISYKWLKEYVDFTLSPQEVCAALTSAGLEVDAMEEVESIRGGLKGLFVGEVLTCEEHPNSDHLHVTTVDLGKGSPQQIVCGAPNVRQGQKVIVADLGCVLYDGDKEFQIKRSKLRGVESLGMICAEDEIGVGSSHDGIIVLPESAKVGMPASEYYHVESDYLIEIDITANRGDALSHWGVARDLYAYLKRNGYETSLHRPSSEEFSVDDESLKIDVRIENQEACKRYACVSLSGCEVKESPDWLKTKLQTIGLRPINNIVDITNFVMMAYGQPLHCFDADMVEGHTIVVKDMPEGTPFVTLDGVEHKLSSRDLAICNAQEPMCIAGVFGGKGSGTYETTRNVVLESAYFNPTWIRKSARRHGLSTDASFRFERGVDPDGIIYALKQAAILVRQLAGGRVSMQINDVYPEVMDFFHVDLSYDYVNTLVGKSIGKEMIKSIVESLEMRIDEETESGLKLSVPPYRTDVQRPCDVVEDILRIYGYNNVEIPTSLKSSLVIKGLEDKRHIMQEKVSEQLVGCGFQEIMNNSLTRGAYYNDLEAFPKERLVEIYNPLSSDLNVMRETLLFGGLESIQHNVNRKNANLKFFEFGNVYRHFNEKKNDDDPMQAYEEETNMSILLTGNRVEGSWAHATEKSSFYELKAYVENIFARLGIPKKELTVGSCQSDIFSEAISIETRSGKPLAQLGVVSRKALRLLEVEQEVYFAEIEWTKLTRLAAKKTTLFKEISKYPKVSRDLALLVDKGVKFQQIEAIAQKAERKLLKSVELFDVYEGKNLAEGKKSYAVNFILQDESRTLNDKQIDATMQKITNALCKELQAQLR